jgi:predicted Zn-dependent protease
LEVYLNSRGDDLWRRLQQAQQAIDAQDLETGEKLLTEVEVRAAQAGIESQHLLWVRSVLNDYQGKHETALDTVNAAIAKDPLCPVYRSSLAIIIERIRTGLANKTVDSRSVPRLWDALTRAGEADDTTHLALAQHQVACGKLEDALRTLDALTTLAPTNVTAWNLKVHVASQLDRRELAEDARLQAVALGALGGSGIARG